MDVATTDDTGVTTPTHYKPKFWKEASVLLPENKNLIGPNRRKMSTLACTGLTRKRTKIFVDLHGVFFSENLFKNSMEELCVYEKNRKSLPPWDAGESSWFTKKTLFLQCTKNQISPKIKV